MEIKSTDVRGYGKLLMIGTAMLLAGCNSVFVLSGNPLQPSSKPAITQATLAAGTVGNAYSSTIEATGGTSPYSYGASNLPSGLASGSSTGVITGTPAQSAIGTRTVSVEVRDSTQPTSQSVTANLSITIAAAVVPSTLSITTTSLPGGTVGTAYSGAVVASGGTTPYTFNASNLPSGLSIIRPGQSQGRRRKARRGRKRLRLR